MMSLGTLPASLALSSLCSVRALLQAVLQTEDMLKVYEARLTEEETVCLDLDKVEAYRCGLKVTQGVAAVAWPPGSDGDLALGSKTSLHFHECFILVHSLKIHFIFLNNYRLIGK